MDDQDRRWSLKEWWRSLAREQKMSVVVLGLCGFASFGLAIWHVRAEVVTPFFVSKSVLQQSRSLLASSSDSPDLTDPSGLSAAEVATLKSKDTDHDGLNDYDELYVYHTSPYLADTDSDGIPDAVEVAQGTDPNCPKGTNCSQVVDNITSASTSQAFQEFLSPNPIPTSLPDVLVGQDASSVQAVQAFIDSPPSPDGMNAAQIRDFFLSHNLVSKADLDQLSDSSIVDLYRAAYDEATRVQAAGQTPSASSTGASPMINDTTTSP